MAIKSKHCVPEPFHLRLRSQFMSRGLQLLISLCAIGWCASAVIAQSFPIGEVVEEVATLADLDQTYALYLPSSYDQEASLPVVFVLDPRGRGLMALDLFKQAAERNGFIVVSSYRTRSDTNTSVTLDATLALLNDVPRRFKVDQERVVLAGMSGTAHTSWMFGQALEGRLAAVIACAGGVQVSSHGPPEDTVPFAYYGITGDADFNYQEMMALEQHLHQVGSAHRFEVFEGRHGWAPVEQLSDALDWIKLRFLLSGSQEVDTEFVEQELDKLRERRDTTNEPLEQLRHARALARDFGGHGYSEEDATKLATIESAEVVQAAIRTERKLAGRERLYRRDSIGRWVVAMTGAESAPTLSESMTLLQLARMKKQEADSDPVKAMSAKRVLETLYTQAIFYVPRTLEERAAIARAATSLRVAHEVFPDRSGPHWRLAGLFANAGKRKQAMAALTEAVHSGPADLERLRTDPTWEPLHGLPEWQALLGEMEELVVE